MLTMQPSPARRLIRTPSTRLVDPHLADAVAHDAEVVEGEEVGPVGTGHGERRQHARRPVALAEPVKRGGQRLGADRGEDAEAAAGHAQHGEVHRHRGADGGEHRPVAADRDDQVAVTDVAGLGHRPVLPGHGDLHDGDVVLARPGQQPAQRRVDVARRVHHHADAVDAPRSLSHGRTRSAETACRPARARRPGGRRRARPRADRW